MLFFKRFSFRHRRTKSDSAAILNVISREIEVARSHSLEELSSQAYDGIRPSRSRVFEAVFPQRPVATISPKTCDGIPSFSSPPTDVHSALRRIRSLDAKVDDLISANKEWAGLCALLQEQVTENQSERLIAMGATATTKRLLDATKLEVERLQAKLEHFERFMGLVTSIGLHELVLDKAQSALRAGLSADEALVDAIKEAAAKPGSAWMSIMPAIVGPRSPEQYVAAINLTLKLRKDLKYSRKVAKFWKKTAKEDGMHDGLVTPSASNLSDIHEVLPADRQKAVDDRLSNLRGDLQVASRPTAPEPAEIMYKSDSGHLQPAFTICDSLSSSGQRIEEDSISPSSTSETVSNPPPVVSYTLPPLASESFHLELATRSSAERLFRRQSGKFSVRPVLGEVDMNIHYIPDTISKSESIISQNSKLSAKAIGKRRAMVVTQSIESITASIRSEERERRIASSYDVITSSADAPDVFSSNLNKPHLNAHHVPGHTPGRRQPSDYLDMAPLDDSAFLPLFDPSLVLSDASDPERTLDTRSTFVVKGNLSVPAPLAGTAKYSYAGYNHHDAIIVLENTPPRLVMIAEESEDSLGGISVESTRGSRTEGTTTSSSSLGDRDLGPVAESTNMTPTTLAMEPEAHPATDQGPSMPPHSAGSLVAIVEESEGLAEASVTAVSGSQTDESVDIGDPSSTPKEVIIVPSSPLASPPIKEPIGSPDKTSKLPVFKQFRRLSLVMPSVSSPKKPSMPPTGPLSINKRKNSGTSSIPVTPAKIPLMKKTSAAFSTASSRVQKSAGERTIATLKVVRRLSSMVTT